MPKIICAQCKAIENVQETPSSAGPVLCSSCRRVSRGKTSGAQRPRKNIPRKQHGTRVMLPITCAECGEPDTLDYVPKGANLDEVLCSKCAREEFGTDSDWARVDRSKQRESSRKEWAFECAECGRTDYVPFEPHPERTYECNLCRLDHDTPSPGRLDGREKAAGGVFIRRRNPDKD